MAVTRVDSGSNSVSSATEVTVSTVAAPVAGNLLIALHYTGNVNTASTLTGPAGWTLYSVNGGLGATAPAAPTAIWYRIAQSGDGSNWTFGGTGGATFQAAFVGEYNSGNGAWVSPPTDRDGNAHSGSATTLSVAASAANTQANDFGIAQIGVTGSNPGFSGTWTGGFEDGAVSVANRLRYAVKEMSAVETTSTSTTWTTAGTPRGTLATFKIPAASAPTQTVSPPFQSRTAAVHAPTVAPGPVTVAPPFQSRTASVFAPTVVPGTVTVAPPFQSRTAVVHAPSASAPAPTQTVSPPLLSSTAAVYAPTALVGTTVVSPPLLSSPSTAYDPTVVPGPVTVAPPLLASDPAIFEPSLLGIVTVAPLRATSSAKTYAPYVGSAPQTVGVELLSSPSAAHAPVIGTQTFVTVPMFRRYPAVIAPAVLSTARVTLERLSGTAAALAPTAAQFLPVAPPLLSGPRAVHAPTALTHTVVSVALLSSPPLAMAPGAGTEVVEVLWWDGQRWVPYETVHWNGLRWVPMMPMVEG